MCWMNNVVVRRQAYHVIIWPWRKLLRTERSSLKTQNDADLYGHFVVLWHFLRALRIV